MDFICPPCKCVRMYYVRTHLRTNVRTRQDKDYNYVRTQVKIAKDGFVYVRT